MPEPWPAAPRVAEEKTTPEPRRLTWGRFFRASSGRFAIAACVALLVSGYLGLQAWFPDPRPVAAPGIGSGEFGKLLRPGYEFDRTKSGRPVGVEVQPPSRGKSQIIVIEELPAKKN